MELEQVKKKIKKLLAPKYKFSYFTREDIEQEIEIMCLEAMSGYDGVRPLENYLMSHCKKRLINLKRMYSRKPDLCNSSCQCPRCLEILERAEQKKMSLDFVDIDSLDPDSDIFRYLDIPEMASLEEVMEIIDEELPRDLRPDYLKLLYGITINAHDRKRVFGSILKILEYYENEKNQI